MDFRVDFLIFIGEGIYWITIELAYYFTQKLLLSHAESAEIAETCRCQILLRIAIHKILRILGKNSVQNQKSAKSF